MGVQPPGLVSQGQEDSLEISRASLRLLYPEPDGWSGDREGWCEVHPSIPVNCFPQDGGGVNLAYKAAESLLGSSVNF